MKIDLHIHSKNGSDGKMTLKEIFSEARKRSISIISITDHDSILGQEEAGVLAEECHIQYVTGLELNISFAHPDYRKGKPVSLDLLAYQFDIHDSPLREKLIQLRDHRRKRAKKILENLNRELEKEGLPLFTDQDLQAIEETVDGAFGRPHIANYLINKGLVKNKEEAFDKYLVQCDVPKMPLSLPEASQLVRRAGGKLALAHGNDPNGTSLVKLTDSLPQQLEIIKQAMVPLIDGLEVWHPRHGRETRRAYLDFATDQGLMVTGGSDCHQQPILMGTQNIPDYVAEQFGF